MPSAGLFLTSRGGRPGFGRLFPLLRAKRRTERRHGRAAGQSCGVRAPSLRKGWRRACRRASCTERRFPAGGVTPKGLRHKRGEKTSGVVPVVRAKPDCGFLPNASKHTKARKQAGLRLHPCQAGLCLLSALSRTAASCRMRQSIQKQENKPDCACRSCKVGLRLLSGVYDGYGISPYEGQGRAFSCEKIYKSGFPKRRGRGCSSFPSRRVMRKRSGRSNASASAETVARSENCRARAFSRCCWGCCSDACADATARSANGRAQACSAFCMTEVRFLYQRRHVCTYGEWQSAGVPFAAVGDVVPTLVRTRPHVLRMAERGRAPPSVCQRYDSFVSAGTFVHTANGRAQAFRPPVVGAAVPTLARTRPNGAGA